MQHNGRTVFRVLVLLAILCLLALPRFCFAGPCIYQMICKKPPPASGGGATGWTDLNYDTLYISLNMQATNLSGSGTLDAGPNGYAWISEPSAATGPTRLVSNGWNAINGIMYCSEFDGSDDVFRRSYVNRIGVNQTNDWSISVFAKATDENPGATLDIISQYDASNLSNDGRFLISQYASDKRCRVFLGSDSRSGLGNVSLYSAVDSFPSNEWHQVGLERSGNVFNMYFDGALCDTVDEGGTQRILEDTSLYVGARLNTSFNYGSFFAGQIDNARVYSNAIGVAGFSNIFVNAHATNDTSSASTP